MRKVFFVSRGFPFERVIYPGCGPEFGEAYGWEVRRIDEIEHAECDAAVVETRLLAEDLAVLERFLARPASRRFPVFFKVSDPEMPLSADPGTRYLFAKADYAGVHYASVYEPAGPLREALASMRRSRAVRIPYPYDARREVDRPVEGRRRRVFLAGKRDPRLYPLRQVLIRRHRWNPLVRAAVVRLRHPGYPDLGRPPRHDLMRAKFVEMAARHTHFFLDGSRYGVELMKYSECAYAGCAPFGEVVGSVEPFAPATFARSRGGTLDLWRAVRAPAEVVARAAADWRAAYRTARDPARLDAAIDAELERIL